MVRNASLFLCLVLSTAMICRGQCPSNKNQWDFSGSYGFISTSQFSGIDNQESTRTVTSAMAALFVSVRYFAFNRLAVGVAVGVSGEDGRYNDPFVPHVLTSTYSYNSRTVAVEVYYVYYFRKRLEVYTFLGAGPSISGTQTTEYTGAQSSGVTSFSGAEALKAQYTPIGIRLGGRFGLYAEVGYGYKGMLNVGLSYKPGPSCWWRKDI